MTTFSPKSQKTGSNKRSKKSLVKPTSQSQHQHASIKPNPANHEEIMQLQRQFGNAFVRNLFTKNSTSESSAIQRDETIIQREEYPTIDHLPAMTQILLTDVMQQVTIDAAVRKIYHNMFNRTGWKYNASISNTAGEQYVTGGTDVGMCESYSHAFINALQRYDELRQTHPVDAIKNGALDFAKDEHLGPHRFYTRQGLTLMGGTALQGNVYREVDGAGNVINDDVGTINRFVFKGHWYVIINGVAFDPIFYSIGQDNVGGMLDNKYKGEGSQFIADTTNPVGTGEFGAQFIWINDEATFTANVEALTDFYDRKSNKIDAVLNGNWGKRVAAGVWKGASKKKNATVIKQLRAELARLNIDMATFLPVVEKAYETLLVKRPQVKAIQALRDLLAI